MLSLAQTYKTALLENSKCSVEITLVLANGTTLSLADADIMEGGVSFTESVSSSGSFDIGGCITGKMDLTLNNTEGKFNDYDFSDAVATVWLRIYNAAGTSSTRLKKGVYNVDQPSTYGPVISLECLDNMVKLEKEWADANTTFPATLRTIVANIATTCGVSYSPATFPNYSVSISRKPDPSGITCGQMLAYVAQLACCWVKCNPDGTLVFSWYNKNRTTVQAITSLSSLSVFTDDITITGIRVNAQSQVNSDGTSGADGETVLEGAEGYVIGIEDNPLVLYGTAADRASFIAGRAVGLEFRPFQAQAIGMPWLEAGDAVTLTDEKGETYNSYVTSTTYKLGSYQNISCDAESPGKRSATEYSAAAKAYLKARTKIEAEQTAREEAVKKLTQMIADNSNGMYQSTETLADGSHIYYLHNQPDIKDSDVIWKLNANGLGISTDGGKTYTTGLDVDGNAILNRIYAIGLDADYINTGAINVTKNGKTLFMVDVDTGAFHIQDAAGKNIWDSNTGFTLSGYTETDDAVKSVDIEYALSTSNTSAPSSGWASTVAWQKGRYVWQRQKMTYANGDVKYSTPSVVAGADGTGVKSVEEQFYQSTSNAKLVNGVWSNKQQAYDKNKFYWTRVATTYTDGTVAYSPSATGQVANAYNTVNTLDQQEVFNRLTQNGKEQGIYLSNGLLYLNGTYIKTGDLDAARITAGVLKDKKGKFSFNLDSGAIKASDISASGTFSSTKKINNNLSIMARVVAGALELGQTRSNKWINMCSISAQSQVTNGARLTFNSWAGVIIGKTTVVNAYENSFKVQPKSGGFLQIDSGGKAALKAKSGSGVWLDDIVAIQAKGSSVKARFYTNKSIIYGGSNQWMEASGGVFNFRTGNYVKNRKTYCRGMKIQTNKITAYG